VAEGTRTVDERNCKDAPGAVNTLAEPGARPGRKNSRRAVFLAADGWYRGYSSAPIRMADPNFV